MKKYVIRPGDTMYAISKKTGVRLPLLLAANPHITSPAQLQPGTTIVIPELGKPAKHQIPAEPAQKPTEKPTSKAGKQGAISPEYFGFVWPHVVGKNETVSQIAKRYRVTLSQISQLNPNLDVSRPLRPGTVLYIPYMESKGAKKAKQTQPKPGPGTSQQQTKPKGPEVKTLTQTQPQSQQIPQSGDIEGPHSHSPFRTSDGNVSAKYGVPKGWDGDVDESSSLLSSWDPWDKAMRTIDKKQGSSHSEDGWSDTISIQRDEDD